ncbi:T9SS type A sorting domain-containing protein [bacterium]|nr:T9SS type A sorting domain-containing protein [bacterium]
MQQSAFPNPFNSSCAITAPAGAGNLSRLVGIEIYDLRGNVVVAVGVRVSFMKPHDEKGFDESNPYIWTPDQTSASGLYLVRATMGNGGTITKRIVYLK